MDSVTLTPHGSLIFSQRPGDWREQVFDLAARRDQVLDEAIRFWRRIGEYLLASLCRLPENFPVASLAQPADLIIQSWISGAPPMSGGEYLNEEVIRRLWLKVAGWIAFQTGQAGSLASFLAKRAPNWERVGRITFHLAENKGDLERPFAFMASYISGLTETGRERHMPLHMALSQSGEVLDQPLFELLKPIRLAARRLKWVGSMMNDRTVYQPVSLSVSQAHQFLQDVPVLESCGLTVLIPNWWQKRPAVKVKVVIGQERSPKFGLNSLLDWNVRLAAGDIQLTDEEAAQLLEGTESLVCFKGQWLEADREKLEEALKHWRQIQLKAGREGLSFVEAMRLLAGYPARTDQPVIDLERNEKWVTAEAGRALAETFKNLKSPEAVKIPDELKATLRPYQEKGLSWLSIVSCLGLGGCLADDMGLGKTMQVLALLLLDRQRSSEHHCSLLVVPASLLGNWKMEAQKFAPSLKLNVFHPSETPREKLNFWERHPKFLQDDSDLVVTSYNLLGRYAEFFSNLDWHMMIIDEAQAVKNPVTAQSRAVRKIKARTRLALTGTPIENRLEDIWSLFDFLNPGLLGSAGKFRKAVSVMMQSSEDQYAPLRRLVAPYLLRRLKTDRNIISDLPDKTETTVQCWLSKPQARIYNQLVEQLAKNLKTFSSDPQDQFRRRGLVLQYLMKLRQLCNHPAQLTGDGDWSAERSGKFLRIAELTGEMAERQEKLLLFTQFQEIIEPLNQHLAGIFGRTGLILHGGTRVSQRLKLVEQFQQEDGPPYFILSLRAGGTGLNLTAAGHVIHFDRWWNPAVEDQATDRAYRIGQKKNVLVHKCVTRGTLEERIDLLLAEKRQLAEEILNRKEEISLANMDDQALMKLIQLDIDRAIL